MEAGGLTRQSAGRRELLYHLTTNIPGGAKGTESSRQTDQTAAN